MTVRHNDHPFGATKQCRRNYLLKCLCHGRRGLAKSANDQPAGICSGQPVKIGFKQGQCLRHKLGRLRGIYSTQKHLCHIMHRGISIRHVALS